MHAPKPIEPAELAAIIASLAQWHEDSSDTKNIAPVS
jgi:hypothetical protein